MAKDCTFWLSLTKIHNCFTMDLKMIQLTIIIGVLVKDEMNLLLMLEWVEVHLKICLYGLDLNFNLVWKWFTSTKHQYYQISSEVQKLTCYNHSHQWLSSPNAFKSSFTDLLCLWSWSKGSTLSPKSLNCRNDSTFQFD